MRRSRRGAVRAMAMSAAATGVCALPVFLTGSMAVQISEDLQFGTLGIGTISSVFFGAVVLTAIPFGRLADRLGAPISLRIAVVSSAIASLSAALLTRSWLTLAMCVAAGGAAMSLVQPAANRMLVTSVGPRRLATAFGLKQSAPAVAALAGGLAVPAFALTVGWRWAYLAAAVLGLTTGVWSLTAPNSRADLAIPSQGRTTRLSDRLVIIGLAGAFGLSLGSSAAALAYFVTSAVRAGGDSRTAGFVLAVASLSAIIIRVIAGILCDRYPIDPLRLSSGLVGIGALGLGALSTGSTGLMYIGMIVAMGGIWGFTGLFWFSIVRRYPGAPGRATGLVAPSTVGSMLGPLSFGLIATAHSYQLAWMSLAAVSVLAAVALGLLNQRLTPVTAVPIGEPDF